MKLGKTVLRSVPLWMLVSAGLVIPASCSSKDDDKSSGATGGAEGTGGEPSYNLGGGPSELACKSFQGLENCGSNAVVAETTPVNILLVLDKSGSMSTPPEPDSDVSLWEATRSALTTALKDAPAAVSFGLQMYPAQSLTLNCSGKCCDMPEGDDLDVPIGSGKETRDDIVELLNRTTPGGGTPTAAALARAYQYFSTGPGADLEGDRFVLLATDGGPNCNPDATCGIEACTVNIDKQCMNPAVNCCATNRAGCLDDVATQAQIEMLRSIGVDTFVVGLAGTDEYAEQLNAFAEAGGRPRQGTPEKYFKVDAKGSAEGLVEVLNEITTQLVQSCDLQLAKAPPDVNEVNVAVDCEIVPWGSPSEDPMDPEPPMGGNGGQGGMSSDPPASDDPDTVSSYWWLDDSTDPPTIRLGGEVCSRIANEGVERIDVLLGCPTVR